MTRLQRNKEDMNSINKQLSYITWIFISAVCGILCAISAHITPKSLGEFTWLLSSLGGLYCLFRGLLELGLACKKRRDDV